MESKGSQSSTTVATLGIWERAQAYHSEVPGYKHTAMRTYKNELKQEWIPERNHRKNMAKDKTGLNQNFFIQMYPVAVAPGTHTTEMGAYLTHYSTTIEIEISGVI